MGQRLVRINRGSSAIRDPRLRRFVTSILSGSSEINLQLLSGEDFSTTSAAGNVTFTAGQNGIYARSISSRWRKILSDDTTEDTDSVIYVANGSTVTLHNSVGYSGGTDNGQRIWIKNIDTVLVNVDAQVGSSIDGNATFALNQNESVEVQWDADTGMWRVLSYYVP